MTKEKINILLGAIISTLNEVEEAADGWICAALMGQGVALDEFNLLREMLLRSDLVEAPCAHVLRITARGRELATEINSIKQSKEC